MLADIKGSCICRLLSVVICVTLVGTPLVVQAQDIVDEAQVVQHEGDPCVTAHRDATMHINKGTWFLIGCLAGLVGWIIAYAIEPNPPAAALVGKSPQYVATYTDCYKSKGKSLQSGAALTGCLIGTAVSVLLWVVVLAAEDDSESGY